MFCTSLRRRDSFAGIVNSLTLPSTLRLRENDLKTHDIALALSASGDTRPSRQLRVLLLSPSTVSSQKLTSTIERIRRFASLTGGKDLAIVFLLYPDDDGSEQASAAGMMAYAKLQAEMMDHPEIPTLPILPLPKADGLANILKSHQKALAARHTSNQKVTTAAAFELLRQCSNNPPIAESVAFVLTDDFSDLRELAWACTEESAILHTSSPSGMENGMKGASFGMSSSYHQVGVNNSQETESGSGHSKLRHLQQLQGDAQYQDLVQFWNEEFTV